MWALASGHHNHHVPEMPKPACGYIYLHGMQSIALHPVQVSLPITINLVSLTRRSLARSHGLYFVSISRVALVPGHDGVGAAVADVLPNDVPERSGHYQGRRDGCRQQGEPHGRVAAPAALPRLLRPSKLATCIA